MDILGDKKLRTKYDKYLTNKQAWNSHINPKQDKERSRAYNDLLKRENAWKQKRKDEMADYYKKQKE